MFKVIIAGLTNYTVDAMITVATRNYKHVRHQWRCFGTL